jgi:maleamate amidohydrolase
VLDAFSLHYRVCVVEDGCFDRFEMSHAASLYDMNAKYADVRKSDAVVEFIGTLPTGLFELPAGTP